MSELIAGLEVRPAGGPGPRGVRVCDVTDDSRTVVPGSLFVARAGTKSDGKAFVGEAVRAGAVAVLAAEAAPAGGATVLVTTDVARIGAAIAERFYGEPSATLDLIGVTGTNGKTTTAHLIHQLLNGVGRRCGLIGTVQIDDGREVAAATLTTPPAWELSRTLGTMVESGCVAAVMEASSHALDQGRVAALRFDVGIFTNLTGDHLDYHGTMEAYADAKARLFAMLPVDGWAIVNAQDPWHERMVRDCRARIVRCEVGVAGQVGAQAEARAVIESASMSGMRLTLAGPWGSERAEVGLIGAHNAMNAVQALAACYALGVPMRELVRGIERAVAPPGRLEPVTSRRSPFQVLVDYAHTDDALRKVLTTLRPLRGPGGRLVVVFGCGGDRDRTKRPRMGEAASELADRVIVTSDNPRSEEPEAIIREIVAGVPLEQRARVEVEADRAAAIGLAVGSLSPGDILVIAGKGHETEQIVSDGGGGLRRLEFDDREAARAALGTREAFPERGR
ncbi:MAG: UDP-N-acetylmuramoyl-L-alanyl-D-glutamate--2,6-diaminopimelate ligase [Phycisphaerales bacterium]